MNKETRLKFFAWWLSSSVSVVAIISWASGFDWDFSSLNTYSLFPLFGLLAFSVMWSHYIVSALRQYQKIDAGVTKCYFDTTSWVVLIAIFLHPGLLIFQLWRDGFGLPPQSYLANYVMPSLRWVAMLGTVSWLVFVAYELRRKFAKKPWWKYVQYASDVAMLAIFYHGLQLGGNLQSGWFRYVWLLYGATLITALSYTYIKKLSPAKIQKPPK